MILIINYLILEHCSQQGWSSTAICQHPGRKSWQ